MYKRQPQGEAEALEGGKLLKDRGLTFDVAYTSVLKRAIKTLWIIMETMELEWIPVIRAWACGAPIKRENSGRAGVLARHSTGLMVLFRTVSHGPLPHP